MSNSIIITQENAIKAMKLPKGSTPKEIVETLCGKIETSADIRDHIKGIDDALKMWTPTSEQQKALNSGSSFAVNATLLEIGYKALNTNPVTMEVWEPDFDNKNERKYEPVFVNKPGVGFVFHYSYHGNGGTTLGSRLQTPNDSLCKYGAEIFLPIWNKFLLK